jgi:hypothetical protein
MTVPDCKTDCYGSKSQVARKVGLWGNLVSLGGTEALNLLGTGDGLNIVEQLPHDVVDV